MNTIINSNNPAASVILLDTNVLHYLDLYTKSAKRHGWYPFGKAQRPDSSSDQNPSDQDLKQAYEKGEAVMRFIQKKQSQVQYSPVSELELMVGRLKGRALVKAADQGVPYRMWSRLNEREINRRLNGNDFLVVHRDIGALKTILQEDLKVEAVVSRGESMSEVWSIARGLVKIVFLDPADCLIYATALVVGAEYLVTADRYFANKVNRIHGSQKRGDGARVRELLIKVSPVDEEDLAELPRAIRPPEMKT